jgi:hypothetical protein
MGRAVHTAAFVLLTAGCSATPVGELGDHCITTRDASGAIQLFVERDVGRGRLQAETQYFTPGNPPVGSAVHTYRDGLWVKEDFDGSPDQSGVTRRTLLDHDEAGLPVQRQIATQPDNVLESFHAYTWDGGRLVETYNETPFGIWEETWEWDGDTARVTQVFDVGTVVREIRAYQSTEHTWPVLDREIDLPGLALVARGQDEDDDGTLTPPEYIFERALDDAGVPTVARRYNTGGGLVSETTWDACE